MQEHLFAMRQRSGRTVVAFIFLPYAIYALSSIDNVNLVLPYLALFAMVALLIARPLRIAVFGKAVLWAILILSLLGSTGWFFSPFFFALHLFGIALGFLYNPVVTAGFIASLFSLFFFNGQVGGVNITYDFLTLLSLLSVIPITVALRKSFLLVEQERKGILILEGGEQKGGITTLESILANRVNRLSILLRQPITYIRQGLDLLRKGSLTPSELNEVESRMEKSVDGLSTIVDEFESGTTKNALLSRRGKKGTK